MSVLIQQPDRDSMCSARVALLTGKLVASSDAPTHGVLDVSLMSYMSTAVPQEAREAENLVACLTPFAQAAAFVVT